MTLLTRLTQRAQLLTHELIMAWSGIRRPILGSMLILGVTGAVLAQTVEGLDLDVVRARSEGQAADAAALVNEVARRADEFKEDAKTVQANALAKVETLDAKGLPVDPNGPVDFDEIVSAASANLKDNRGGAPLFMVFVSLSMPDASLKRVIQETSAAGGVVVFRGFPGNSAKQFLERLSKVIEKDSDFASIGIDPRLFRAFEVSAVPTYVVTSTDFDLCDGLACRTTPPPFDRMSGNVSVEYALGSFAEDNGPGALVARTALGLLRNGS